MVPMYTDQDNLWLNH